MKRPRITFFIPGLNVGGAERHTVDLRMRLGARGFPTGLLVHGRRRSAAVVEHPGAAKAVFLDLKGMSDPVGWLRVRAELRRQSANIIVAINQMPLIVAVVTRLLGGGSAKIICVYHTTLLRQNENRLLFLFRWSLRLADALVFVSANQKAYWVERGLKCPRMPVILNGVDLQQFAAEPAERSAMRAHLGFADDDIVVGVVAAFRPEKSHEFVIDALKMLNDRGQTIKLLLVGDGPTRAAVEKKVSDSALEHLVVFAGEQADVRPYIAACDVGALCSVAVETFSLSALEFLAMGIPMIMSRVGGASEIVRDGSNGFLFEPGNLDDFLQKLEAVVDEPTRARLSVAARPSVENLSIESMVDKYANLFEELGTGNDR